MRVQHLLLIIALALVSLQCGRSDNHEWEESALKVDSLIAAGDIATARSLAERELAAAEASPDQRKIVASELALGKVQLLQLDYAQAESTYLKVLAQVDNGTMEDKISLAKSLIGLGVAYCGQGKYRQALEPLERAKQLQKTVPLEGYYDRSSLLYYLGVACQGSGISSSAVRYLEESLRIQSVPQGTSNPVVLQQLSRLASAYEDLKQLDTAEALYRKVVESAKTSPLSGETVYYYRFLARCLQHQDKTAEALYCFQRTLEVAQTTSSSDTVQRAICLYDLGNCLRELERYAPAESLLTVALALLQNNSGSGGGTAARAMFYLGLLRRDQKRFNEADALFRQSLQTTETAYGGNSIELAEDLEVFARFLVYRNRLLEAEQSFRRAIAITESASGPNYWKLVKYYDDLAGVLEKLGKKPEMLEAKKRAESIRSNRG